MIDDDPTPASGHDTAGFDSPAAVAAALADHDYLAAPDLATAVFLALRLRRPLFCEGEPGVGKTSLAAALAAVGGGTLFRLQCYEGIDAAQALYDWDFPRQLLHVRSVSESTAPAAGDDGESLAGGVYGPDFLLERPVLAALRASRPGARAVLLVDEIDRADDEFEALLLEVLDEGAVTVPELGRITAAVPPVVIVTSNRTRDVHDALKRRCIYHWLDLPGRDLELEIVRRHVPEASATLATRATELVVDLRTLALDKRPGVAESIDFVRALAALGATEPTAEFVRRAVGTLVKTREDLDVVRAAAWPRTP